MPTNLPPDYYEVERQYRQATSIEEKMACLEEMLRIMPHHKGTDKLRADLRKKLSKLKAQAQAPKKAGKRDSAFQIDKEGAGQIAVIGPPNVGKSALVAALTNATPEVAAFPFTTWKPTPGMMPVENIQFQLIDTPPLNPDYVVPQFMALIRRADLILLVVDVLTSPVQQLEDAIALLEEQRILPLHWQDRYEPDRRLTFIPFLVLANKCDDEESDELYEIFGELISEDWSTLPISATTGRNFDQFKQIVFDRMQIIRVYSKAPGREPDWGSPFVLPIGTTLEEFAGKVHKDFSETLKGARVWGSATHDGMMVPRDHVLQDEDVVELRA